LSGKLAYRTPGLVPFLQVEKFEGGGWVLKWIFVFNFGLQAFQRKKKIYGVQLLDLLITANENYFFLDSGRGPGNNSQLPVSLAGSH